MKNNISLRYQTIDQNRREKKYIKLKKINNNNGKEIHKDWTEKKKKKQ